MVFGVWGGSNVMVEVSAPLSVVVCYLWLNVCSDWLPVVRVGCYLEVVCVVYLSVGEGLFVIRIKPYIP